ncbi:NAD(P)-dependent oxidoreductase [Bacillus carboniphilus]|uniref:NAD(P)-dependent oxidoreductase n=1 Tax=Bacillus carboniphilus TaxID=86663 RepID=A0ABY9JUU3_9BACI|nr:NAD(P)-dependent oxidoreductase [Bacillus carboniphilus]WLR43174.1 NAD(P)-dependent oxidoreductase [Bacillus carboniphilus]
MMKKIGFIGTGVMGKSMVSHLLKAGYTVNIHTRTKSKAQELIDKGAIWKDTVAEIAQTSELVMTMVGYPKDVEEIYLGSKGLIENLLPEAICIDLTTSKPSLAKKLSEIAKEQHVSILDAPVSGGDIGAKNGTLTVMVGGEEKVFQEVKPILEYFGENIILQGPHGAGQHTKMCNQIAIASGMIGVCEAMAYAEKSGLDPKQVLESITGGAAGSWSLSHLAPRMLEENYDPGFYIKHFIKDIEIAIEEADAMELFIPGLTLAKQLYEKLSHQGDEDLGTQALYKLFN